MVKSCPGADCEKFNYQKNIDKGLLLCYTIITKAKGIKKMRDYFKRIRCHEGFNRLYIPNKQTRQRAKREVKKELNNND